VVGSAHGPVSVESAPAAAACTPTATPATPTPPAVHTAAVTHANAFFDPPSGSAFIAVVLLPCTADTLVVVSDVAATRTASAQVYYVDTANAQVSNVVVGVGGGVARGCSGVKQGRLHAQRNRFQLEAPTAAVITRVKRDTKERR
jgi:hypothetical protein